MPCSLTDLIPVPRHIAAGSGGFDTRGRPWRCHPDSLAAVAVAWKLRSELRVEVADDALVGSHEVRVGAPCMEGLDPPAHAQGYALRITPEGLVLRGTDADGLYWGLVTVEQLLEGADSLPTCEIHDWPTFTLRGHHDDISRKQVSKPEDFLRIIRSLSRYKINVYSPYIEDMLFLAPYPDIGAGRGRLMPDDVAAMLREAARHNVMILPTFSLAGHQENLLANPCYAHLGRRVFQPMSTFDLGRPIVRDFLRTVIADVCALFPAPYFHAAFDEMIGVEGDEFLEHANWCARELSRHGKTMVIWADMFYNHFGVERMAGLDPSIVPVHWCYDGNPGERTTHGRTVRHADLCAQGRPVWGLAGYANWGRFLPDVRAAKANIDAWVRVGLETGTPALFASQWGDEGYENPRDQCWNLFAYLGEAAWSGPTARPEDFERRFQQHFYGVALPALEAVLHELPGRLSMGLGTYWRQFRRTAWWFDRWAQEHPEAAPALASDERELSGALEQVESCRAVVLRNAPHLEHMAVGLLRMRHVTRRHRLALARVKGLDATLAGQGIDAIRQELAEIRDRYAIAWLATNLPQNMEVSLRVFEEVGESYSFLRLPPFVREAEAARYLPLDLDGVFNRQSSEVADVPVGLWRVHGIPFRFAGLCHTHAALVAADAPLDVRFGETLVGDLHLVVAGHRRTDDPHPALRVELLRGGQVVFAEDLLNVLHLCDWWAPLGEHIWAGGGLAHADPGRVRYAVRLGPMMGASTVSRFAFPQSGLRLDGMRLRALCGDEIRVFAATLEVPGG